MSKFFLTEETLTFDELTELILKGECDTVEFKESYSVHFAKYCNTVAAFANTNGGYLIFGVKDDGQILGVPKNEKQRKNIINFILGNVKPSVNFTTDLIETSTGEHIFVIKVSADPLNLHSSTNVYYKRVDSQNQPMESNEIEKYFQKASKLRSEGYSEQPKKKLHTQTTSSSRKGALNEISTILFKIRPYLNRLGYKTDEDLDFGEPALEEGKLVGFTDIRIKLQNKPVFVIEVKRDSSKLSQTHIQQALRYGKALKVPFVAITNGLEFQLFNTETESRLSINGQFFNVLPYKKDLKLVIDYLKNHPTANDIEIRERPQIYKKGVNKNELIKIFKKCHNAIRDIEKDDEHAFSDFSKILFLKLLEEKSESEAHDPNGLKLPRGWFYFDELKANPRGDQVMQSIRQMFASIKEDPKYGEIFEDDRFYADNEETYKFIVDELADISFQDSEVDAKGSAFEYFCKFNLKGSKLGQYFTPREIVNLMVDFIDIKTLVFMLADSNDIPRVVDPACGTGGFLIQAMHKLLDEIKKLNLPKDREDKLIQRVKQNTFWGSDANPTIARTAKMNMVIAGDGSSNIRRGNSLTEEVDFLRIENDEPHADIILANPPFGMSENRLTNEVMRLYDIPTTKGQSLFVQKMIKLTKASGKICTIIDEGILNNPKMEDIRKYILKTCYIDAIVSLPMVTFRPNYTNVKTSFLLLTKKENDLIRQTEPIFVCDLKQVGYDSVYNPTKPTSHEINEEVVSEFRNFQNGTVSYKKSYSDPSKKEFIEDEIKTCFQLTVDEIERNYKYRLDARYNNPTTVKEIAKLKASGAVTLGSLLKEAIYRGNTPSGVEEGVAVIKVRNITKKGINWDTDFVSEEQFERLRESGKIAKKGDILIASTGVGSLGKVGVMDHEEDCAIDGHISVIRIDINKINPDYINAYLWSRLGQFQFDRLYSGSTGQIEIYPDDLDQLLILLVDGSKQSKVIDLISSNREKVEKLNQEIESIQAETTKTFEGLILKT